MSIKIIFAISGYALSISFLAKVILHITLDIANGYKVMLYRSSLLYYLLPYKKPVKEEYETRKMICNKLQRTVLVCFVLFFVLLFIKSIKVF